MSTSASPAPKKKRRFGQYIQNIKDSYTVSRRTYPWVGWALLAITAVILAAAVVLSLVTSQALWYWLIMAVLLALMADMVLLSWTVRRASYTQIEDARGG